MVRVSGPDAVAVVSPLVRARSPLAEFPSHALRLVALVDPRSGERLDEALCVVMRAPRSYTGEDVVELSCHGSPALVGLVTERVIAQGARLASPGEFTQRAYLNGRLDLAQAEAVALLIGARSERAVSLAARALAGDLSRRLRVLRVALLDVIAGLEVALDFPDEGVGGESSATAEALAALRDQASGLAVSGRRGRLLEAGLTVALVGPPNAGKSSLFNALLGRERTIVSPVAGTTRDVVDATIELAGVSVRLLDTAGLGPPRDALDAEGIRRSREAVAASDILLLVLDGTIAPDASALAETARATRVVVLTKDDLGTRVPDAAIDGAVRVSAKTGQGVDGLLARLARMVSEQIGEPGGEDALLVTLRQTEILEALHGSLTAALQGLGHAATEVVLVDLRAALGHVAALLGEEVGDAVLERIFANFCLGK